MAEDLNFLEVIGVLSTTIASLWALLVFLSWVSYRRMIGLPIFGPAMTNAISDKSEEAALGVASQRRESLESFLSDYEFEGVVSQEFIEIPVGFSHVRGRVLEGDQGFAGAHTAHLRWQLSDNRFLLLERVVDSITCLQRTQPEGDTDLFITARLDLLPKGTRTTLYLWRIVEFITKRLGLRPMRTPTLYPWRVVVETADPIRIKEHLGQMSEWIGIRVDLAHQTEANNLGACTIGNNGSLGQVAGVFESKIKNGAEYGIVCHHVLSNGCGSLYWPPAPNQPKYSNYTQGALDAALIHLGGTCFVKGGEQRIKICCASARLLDTFIDNELEVKKWPLLDGRSGILEQPVSAIPTRQGQIRAPHILIIPSFTKRFGVMWPLFPRAFSSAGDSGAWVTDANCSTWFGMVVQGDDPPAARTYALEAEFLLDFFSRVLPREKPFTAKRLV